MAEEKVIFNCEDTLAMKAVATLIQKASSFRSTIYFVRGGRRANSKSLLGVMSLGIENGAEIEITAEGDDAQEAVDCLADFLRNPQV